MGGALQATECFNSSVIGEATVVYVDITGTRAIAFCSVLKEKVEVVESSVLIVAVKFLQHDFSLIDAFESQPFEQPLLFPKKSIEEISPPQKCMFTARLLVANSRSKIHIMEITFFIIQNNRILSTCVL